MEPTFLELRRCIYADATELKRFRQVMVNSVLSTDIFDAEPQNLRMKRWDKTLGRSVDTTREDVNRKATIVLEYLTQASESFHSMSPWIVYEKWSCRKFEEIYRALTNRNGPTVFSK